MQLNSLLGLLLFVAATAATEAANAAQLSAGDRCQIYGFTPRTHAYASCRINLRSYWTTGPCSDGSFAATHREHCHLNLPPFL